MNKNEITKDIENIKLQLSTIESIALEPEVANMSVAEFSALVNSIKQYDISESKESAYFTNVFDSEDYYSNVSMYLDQIIRKISLKAEKRGVSLTVSHNLQSASKTIKKIMDLLVVEYGNLLKADSKRWIAKHTQEMKDIRSILTDLTELQKKLTDILKIHANIISNVILSEFKVLYKFFIYSIKIAKTRNDQLLLVEIAGMTDRIMSMIEPVFSDKSLKTDELIYHYLTYELKELKVSSIGEKLS